MRTSSLQKFKGTLVTLLGKDAQACFPSSMPHTPMTINDEDEESFSLVYSNSDDPNDDEED